ncbi:MAG: hypothetical protein L0Y72_28030 [Gemmataceae bacterium]|nr:hypothetical protein [Gemmataceae bacterium]MCI0742897.1 hypothetical protein [Gemmataceae bacterium]
MPLWLASPLHAQLDPDLDKPYRLQVVLGVAENRFLTPLFREELQQDLQESLQRSLGGLAKVEVVRAHPLLREVEAKGLTSALDALEQLTGLKTHFVLIGFDAGVYTLQARQFDGPTGLASPVVRRAHTTDRSVVARVAAQLVETDFGVVGTVVEAGKDIRLAIQGGKLAPLDRWVKKGDVFAISRLSAAGGKLRGRRVEWALLEALAEPRDGIVTCKLWRRYLEDDLAPAPGVTGYRALKLATISGPLRVRFLDAEQFLPLDGLPVHVFHPQGAKTELSTNRDGLATTRDSFPHFAVIDVRWGGAALVRLPVAIVDERTIVCRLKTQPEAETLATLEIRRDQWLRRSLDSLRLSSERLIALEYLLNKSFQAALESARSGQEFLAKELSQLEEERDGILKQAADKKLQGFDLGDGQALFNELAKKRKDLAAFVERIEAALADEKSEKSLGLTKLLERARLLEGEADFEQALALYGQFLKASPDQKKIREHWEALAKAWVIKDEAHAQARTYFYQVWPRLEVDDLRKNLDKAQKFLSTCAAAQDRLTPLKIVQANVSHAAALKRRLDALRRQDTEDNRLQAKAIAQVADGLRRLHAEAVKLGRKAIEETK